MTALGPFYHRKVFCKAQRPSKVDVEDVIGDKCDNRGPVEEQASSRYDNEDDERRDAWRQYPINLRYIDRSSESISTSTLSHVQKVLCSEDESYTELLEFKSELQDDGPLGETNAAKKTSVSLQIIPFAIESNGKKKLSVSSEDLQVIFHDLQVSPNLLFLLYQAENLGAKTQYHSDGRRMRTEIWFTLPAPELSSENTIDCDVLETVVWFDCLQGQDQTRFLLLRLPQKTLAKLRKLESEVGWRVQHGFEIVIFLITATLGEWFSYYECVVIYDILMEWRTSRLHNEPDVNFTKVMSQLGSTLRRLVDNVTALETLMTVIDFLLTQIETYGILEDHSRRIIFEEQLSIQKHRTRLLISKFNKTKEHLQDAKNLALVHPVLGNGITLTANKMLLKDIAASANVQATSGTEHALETMKAVAVVPMFYLPWISVASGLTMLADLGHVLGISRRTRLYIALSGPLVTFTSWLLYQHSTSLSSVGRWLFSFLRRSPETNPEDKPASKTVNQTSANTSAGQENKDELEDEDETEVNRAARYALLRALLDSKRGAEESGQVFSVLSKLSERCELDDLEE